MLDEKDITLQIFGSLLKDSTILDKTDKYHLSIGDFSTAFERKLFGIIANLHAQGARSIGIIDIENFLRGTASSYQVWEREHGTEYLQDAEDFAQLENFDYYYQKLKKINVLKSLKKAGHNIDYYVCEDQTNPHFIEVNERFEKATPKTILDYYRLMLSEIEKNTGIDGGNTVCKASDNVLKLVESLKLAPDTGPRLQGDIFNTVVRGARRGTFFLRSAASSVGKSRRMVGDACYLSYPIRYNLQQQKWEWAGGTEKSLVIITEQEPDQIQTMILAYLSAVNEDKILFASYTPEEETRVLQAIQIMETYKDNLRICRMANPNISQIQTVVRAEVLANNIGYVFYDYIFSNPALLNEFRDLKVPDYQALGLMSAALKDLSVELGVFVMSSTQLNAQGEDSSKQIKNESAIRGSRAIVDKVDMGCIVSRPTEDELHMMEGLTKVRPNAVTDVYKMRRGRYTQVRIWSYVDLGTCRTEDLVITDGAFNPVPISILKQVYPEDIWGINKNVIKLNNGEILVAQEIPQPVEFADRTVKNAINNEMKGTFASLL